jgi:hypothetical protein
VRRLRKIGRVESFAEFAAVDFYLFADERFDVLRVVVPALQVPAANFTLRVFFVARALRGFLGLHFRGCGRFGDCSTGRWSRGRGRGWCRGSGRRRCGSRRDWRSGCGRQRRGRRWIFWSVCVSHVIRILPKKSLAVYRSGTCRYILLNHFEQSKRRMRALLIIRQLPRVPRFYMIQRDCVCDGGVERVARLECDASESVGSGYSSATR